MIRRASGFTLVETLLAFAITVVIGAVMWNMFISGSTQMEKGTWLSNSQAKVRSGFQHMATLARSASYPTTITPSSINRDSSPANKVTVAAGTHAPGNTTLLSFKICEHIRQNFPNAEDNRTPAKPVRNVEIKLNGKKLEHHEDGALVKAICDDVKQITVEKKPVTAGFEDEKGVVEMKIITTHPNPKFPDTNVVHEGSLSFSVGVN